jgi:hypothetical protein
MLMAKLKTEWLVGGTGLLIISILLEVIARLVYPNFLSFFGLVNFPILVVSALAISKALETTLWLRMLVIGFSIWIGQSAANLGRNWALQQLTANNFKLDLSVLANHGSKAAFMTGLGLSIGILIVLGWLCANFWPLLRQKRSSLERGRRE